MGIRPAVLKIKEGPPAGADGPSGKDVERAGATRPTNRTLAPRKPFGPRRKSSIRQLIISEGGAPRAIKARH
jgi:hypothetical protein